MSRLVYSSAIVSWSWPQIKAQSPKEGLCTYYDIVPYGRNEPRLLIFVEPETSAPASDLSYSLGVDV
jgi:hypothetical protein